jgi:hypothetical protein
LVSRPSHVILGPQAAETNSSPESFTSISLMEYSKHNAKVRGAFHDFSFTVTCVTQIISTHR